MAHRLLYFCVLLAPVCVISSKMFPNFPLEDCSTHKMDLLCLFSGTEYGNEYSFCDYFIYHLFNFPYNKTNPRVLYAAVYDWYSVDNPNVNVSSWRFNDYYVWGLNNPNSRSKSMTQNYKSINETIELKVKFLLHLFSEMGGARKNVTRLAVVFIEGLGLSFGERRMVPHILQQQDTDVKIFVVANNVKWEHKIVYLKDTLLLDYKTTEYDAHLLLVTMCNQCLTSWLKFEHNVGVEAISCYKFYDVKNTEYRTVGEAYKDCYYKLMSDDVAISSEREFVFVQDQIYSYLNDIRQGSRHFPISAFFPLGIVRDLTQISKTFSWGVYQKSVKRPLVVNHWLPGKPSGGYSKECVVWQFDWIEDLKNVSNKTQHGGHWVDGWVDVDCQTKIKFLICEFSLPRRIEDNFTLTIKPATNKSSSKTLQSGSFVKFKDNLVSVSFNFVNKDFLQFLHQTEYELFPLFDCAVDAFTSTYISYSTVCDGVTDCSNNRDEEMCSDRSTENRGLSSNLCPGIYCCDGSCLLWRWVNDGEVHCNVCDNSTGVETNDENEALHKYLNRNETCVFSCNDRCVHLSQLNDGHVDCTGWEGPLDETIGQLETVDTCHKRKGYSVWSPRCVYVRDMYGVVLGCRDMSHLEKCTDFICPVGYVKCPNTYCIPQHYVLDETNDCPTGEDEQSDTIGPCTGNFACWGSKVFLHPDLVCNGHPDCPHKDDEVDCDLKCSEGFRCVSGTVTVSSYNKSIPLSTFPLFDTETRCVDMSGVNLSATNFIGAKIPPKVVFIKFSKCQIRLLNSKFLAQLYYLQDVDFSYNQIQAIDGRDFLFYESLYIRRLNLSHNAELVSVQHLKLHFLETLDLSHTSLFYLHESFIKEFPTLKHLDLSFTFVGRFHKRLFPFMVTLQTVGLRGLHLDSFNSDFLNGLTLGQHLYTDNFEMCCPHIRGNNVPDYMCHAPVNVISSCFDLVGDKTQAVLLWAVLVLIVVLNVGVTVCRVLWGRLSERTCFELCVTSLGISDFIMGAYLVIIIGADYYYRDVYVLNDWFWRQHILCRLAGFLATLSSEASIFLIFLINLDRCLIMKFSFAEGNIPNCIKISALLLSWIIAILLALTPIVFRFELQSSNAMCIGLPLSTTRINGWAFSFGVFIVLNFMLCFAITFFQRVIYRAVSEKMLILSTQLTEDTVMNKQLSLLSLSNILCWFPLGLLGFIALGGHEINNDVYGWITVLVIPIRSAGNSFMYIIPVLQNKWERFRLGGKKS